MYLCVFTLCFSANFSYYVFYKFSQMSQSTSFNPLFSPTPTSPSYAPFSEEHGLGKTAWRVNTPLLDVSTPSPPRLHRQNAVLLSPKKLSPLAAAMARDPDFSSAPSFVRNQRPRKRAPRKIHPEHIPPPLMMAVAPVPVQDPRPVIPIDILKMRERFHLLSKALDLVCSCPTCRQQLASCPPTSSL